MYEKTCGKSIPVISGLKGLYQRWHVRREIKSNEAMMRRREFRPDGSRKSTREVAGESAAYVHQFFEEVGLYVDKAGIIRKKPHQ